MTMVIPMDQTREVQMTELCGLIWNSDSHGEDATDKHDNPYELKSTSTNKEFSTARDLNINTIERYMNCYWVFAFYNGKGEDIIDRMYLCHPDALKPKFEEWLKKMGDANYYCNTLWEYACREMERERIPYPMIAHFKEEINKIFNRGGQNLPGPSIPKGLVEKSLEAGLGIRLELDSHIPVSLQLEEFVVRNPLKQRRPKLL